MAAEAGVPVEERHFTLQELFDADEILVTSSSVQLAPAYELDGKAVGGKAPEVLKAVADKVAEHVRAQIGSAPF